MRDGRWAGITRARRKLIQQRINGEMAVVCYSESDDANYARRLTNIDGHKKWMGMATDYDAPRKTDDDSESIEALKERVPDKMSGVVDVDDADNPGGFELPGADLSDLDLDVVVLPPQADEFTCISCFLVKHRSQIDHEEKLGAICLECAA
jgi:hypothetical protein